MSGENEFATVKVALTIYAYSDTEVYRAVQIGEEVTLSCLTLAEKGAYMKYYINGTESDDVIPSLGESFTDNGMDYRWLLWELGEMHFRKIAEYSCVAYYKDAMVTNMTIDLIAYSMRADPAVFASTAEVNVTCLYDGPPISKMTWLVDNVEVTDKDIMMTQQRGPSRTDILTVSGLKKTQTHSTVQCKYDVTERYTLTVKRDTIVTYADIVQLKENTTYTSDSLVLTCGFEGADDAKIAWYQTKGEKSREITTTKTSSDWYITAVKSDDATQQGIVLHLNNLGFTPYDLRCDIEIGGYNYQRKVSLERMGWETELPENMVELAGRVDLECGWGSSKTPKSVTWLENGEEPLFAFTKTWTEGYAMYSEFSIAVEKDTDATYTCMFEDKDGHKASSQTHVYGASLTMDKDETFSPTPEDNTVHCVFSSAAKLTKITWQVDGADVNDSETQHIFTNLEDKKASLTSIVIDPNLDGDYDCVAEALGSKVESSITLSHTEARIDGKAVMYVTEDATVSLVCTGHSRTKIIRMAWTVNNFRPQSYNKQTYTPYEDYTRSLTMEVDAVKDAVFYESGALEYVCSVQTMSGQFDVAKEVFVRVPVLAPKSLISLDGSWELTCTVITDSVPKALLWYLDDKLLHTNGDIALRSGESNTENGVNPGDDDYVVKAGTYTYRQDGNDFIMSVNNSTYVDSGEYKVVMSYDNEGPDTSSNETVSVRSVLSSRPEIYYAEKGDVDLDCVMYSKVEPEAVKWYKYGKEITGGKYTTNGDAYKSVLTLTDAGITDYGAYTCTYEFEDGNNPKRKTMLQIAKLELTSDASMTVQSGSTLTITATIYSSNWYKYSMTWYHNGKAVTTAQGYRQGIIRSKDAGTYMVTLSKKDMSTSYGGKYKATFTAERYPVALESEEATVSVIGSSSDTKDVFSNGGALTITCDYEGDIKPISVTWLYKDTALDTKKWTETQTAFKDSTMQANISTSAMSAEHSGDYVCVFNVAEGVTVSSTTNVAVKTISISQTGDMYVLDDEWSVDVTVRSEDALRYYYIYVGDIRKYPSIDIEEPSKWETVYTISNTYTSRRLAGSDDGVYTFVAFFSSGISLTSQSFTLIARMAYTTDTRVQTILSSDSTFTKSCYYTGVDQPKTIKWILDGTEVDFDTNHVEKSESRSLTSSTSDYMEVQSTLVVSKAEWEDGGLYTCEYVFDDSQNVKATLPDIRILENEGLEKGCTTSTDGKLALTCKYLSKTTIASIKWYKKYTELKDGFTTSSYKDNAMSSVLTITDGTVSLNDRYYCQAILADDAKVYSMIDIRFATLSIATTNTGSVYTSSSVTLTCKGTGPLSGTKLYKDGKAVSGSAYRYVFKLSDDTAGKYTCMSKVRNTCETPDITAQTESGDAFIEVAASKPGVLSQPADVTASEGETASMVCAVPYVPRVAIKWYMTGSDKVLYGRNVYNVKDGNVTNTLTRKRLKFSMVGTYKCVAKYGTFELESDLATLTLVAFESGPSDTEGLLGGTAMFTCVYSGDAKVDFELKVSGSSGKVTNAAFQTSIEEKQNAVYTTGVATFSTLTSANSGDYYCTVTDSFGTTKSGTATLTVIGFTIQPEDAWVLSGQNTLFQAGLNKYSWKDTKVAWQKKVGETWTDVAEGAKYKVSQSVSTTTWGSQVNLLAVQDSEAKTWRLKLTFPDLDDRKGGTLISDSATINFAGVMEVTVNKDDVLAGSKFTLTCTLTAKEEPRYVKIMFNGFPKRDWTYDTKFENNLLTVTTVQKAASWYSGKEIGCYTRVNFRPVKKYVDFYTVMKTCKTLSIDSSKGKITETDVEVEGSVVGKTAVLECTGTDMVAVDDTKLNVYCNYLTGRWNETMTTCTKHKKTDPREFKASMFFTTGTDYCSNWDMTGIMNTEDDPSCGWRSDNLAVKCYHADPKTCVLLTAKTTCVHGPTKVKSKSSGKWETKTGFTLSTVFNYTGDLEASDYASQKTDVNTIKDRFKGSWFRCTGSRRRRAAEYVLDGAEYPAAIDPAILGITNSKSNRDTTYFTAGDITTTTDWFSSSSPDPTVSASDFGATEFGTDQYSRSEEVVFDTVTTRYQSLLTTEGDVEIEETIVVNVDIEEDVVLGEHVKSFIPEDDASDTYYKPAILNNHRERADEENIRTSVVVLLLMFTSMFALALFAIIKLTKYCRDKRRYNQQNMRTHDYAPLLNGHIVLKDEQTH